MTAALIVLLIGWSAASLLISGRSLAPRFSNQGSLLFFVRQSRLIQSFDVDSAKAPPDVWLKRLGSSAAAQRWQSSDGQRWWMVWLQDGAPLLVLPSTEASEPSRVSSMFPDVELLFADELHRKSFFASLPSRPSTPSSVENQCIDRLSQSTAVAWNPSGLSSIAGPLAFALHSASYGCLTLTLDDRRTLMFDGSVSSRPLSSAPLSSAPLFSAQRSVRRPPDTESAFKTFVDSSPTNNRLALHWQGASTQPLVGSLLQRRLIADEIEKTYGLTPKFQAQWLEAPVDLQVRTRNDGPFKALIQLSLAFPAKQAETLNKGLESLSSSLEQRGLRPQVSQSKAGTNRDQSTDQSRVLIWKDSQQNILGSWSLVSPTPDQISLRLSLGGPSDSVLPPVTLKPDSGLRVRFDVQQLGGLGWLKSTWPTLVKEAGQGEILLNPMMGNRSGQAETWYWLKGQLSLR
jgi:hypothetical protein